MKRISREAAWEILSKHKMVILGHGEASIEETKDIIKHTLDIVPDAIKNMIKDNTLHPKVYEGLGYEEIRWEDDNTLVKKHLNEAFLEKDILYIKEYKENCLTSTAMHIIDLGHVNDSVQCDAGFLMQLIIDVMDIKDEPDNIEQLNEYIEDVGPEKALDTIVRVNCINIL